MSQDRQGGTPEVKPEGEPKRERSAAQRAQAASALEKAIAAKRGELPEYIPPDRDAPEALRDMQHVHRNVKGHDKTHAHKHLRHYLESKPVAFFDQFIKEEKAWRQEKQEMEEATTPTGDKGTELAIAQTKAILERMLKKAK